MDKHRHHGLGHHHHSEEATSDVLEHTVGKQKADHVKLGALLFALQERGFGLLMVVFVLPNCVPIPVPPGVSTIFSLPLLFLSSQMLYGRDAPWLPAWVQEKTIKRSLLAALVSKLSPKLKIVEKLMRPRFTFTDSPAGERLVGFFWFMFALAIAVPLPMTNFLPGLGILFISLGLLSKDGYTMIFGMIVGSLGVAFTIGILLLGKAAVISMLGSTTATVLGAE